MRVHSIPLTDEQAATVARLGNALRRLRSSQVVTAAYADPSIQQLLAARDDRSRDVAAYMVGQVCAAAAIARRAA